MLFACEYALYSTTPHIFQEKEATLVLGTVKVPQVMEGVAVADVTRNHESQPTEHTHTHTHNLERRNPSTT